MMFFRDDRGHILKQTATYLGRAIGGARSGCSPPREMTRTTIPGVVYVRDEMEMN